MGHLEVHRRRGVLGFLVGGDRHERGVLVGNAVLRARSGVRLGRDVAQVRLDELLDFRCVLVLDRPALCGARVVRRAESRYGGVTQEQVGGEVLNFNQGRINVTIDVTEVGEQCQTPPDVTRPERVLLENNADAVAKISLRDVFGALANNGEVKGDGELLFNQIYDSYATADIAQVPSAVHCGDETTNGSGRA